MKLIFKQKMFSWFDSYNIYDAYDESIVYTIKGQLWGTLRKEGTPSDGSCIKIK